MPINGQWDRAIVDQKSNQILIWKSCCCFVFKPSISSVLDAMLCTESWVEKYAGSEEVRLHDKIDREVRGYLAALTRCHLSEDHP